MGCICKKTDSPGTIDFDEENNNYNAENEINENLNEKIENIIYENENEENEDNKIQLKSVKKNNDIDIKNLYDKINQSNNYEIIPIETIESLISPDALNSYQYYKNNKNQFNIEETNTENTIPNSFKMPPIKNKITDEIYEGNYIFDTEKDDFSKIGEGKLITKDKNIILLNSNDKLSNYEQSKVFYNNGNIFIGDISKEYPYEKEKGTLFYKNNNFSSFLTSENYKSNPIKIKKIFPNKDEYEGDAIIDNDIIILEGNGKYKRNKDNSIYEGEFKNNNFNGKGQLFIPLENGGNNEGKLIITNWINGLENGKGFIQNKNYNNKEKDIICYFRFGKIINSIQIATSKKVKLHKNIFYFLTPNENYNLYKNTQMKSMLEYLKEGDNINSIKFLHLINPNNLNVINDKLSNLKILNVSNIINNSKNNIISFIPIQAYKTDGGQVEDRYRYQNIFNPVKNKIYTSHYLHNKRHDISINGVINYHMFNQNNINLNSEIQNSEIINSNDNEMEFIKSQIINLQNNYIKSFEDVDKNYPECDKYRDIIDNRKLILTNSIVGNINNCLFTVHYISIFIPRKFNYFSLVNLPCHFLTVYIHEIDDLKSEKCSIVINESVINQNKNSINNIKNSFSKDIILMETNENFSYIEFDTNSQNEKSMKLLCLIEIKNINYDNNPYIIKLKKYYHFGRYITVKLINQNSLYETQNKNCIDFGTINLYGEVYNLN